MRIDHRLECGTGLATLVDQVAEGREPEDPRHQAACSHCQATLAQLDRIWGEVREVAREEVTPPYSVVATVIDRIRRGLLSLPAALDFPLEQVVPELVRHALLDAERGTTRIADAVVVDVVRAAAHRVPHARLLGGRDGRLGRSAGWLSRDAIAVEVAHGSVGIALRLGIDYGTSVPAIAAAMRAAVIAEVEALTGLRVTRVDIRVEDVFLDGAE
ncbi:MAG: Asp23/Gls24 family envelope stress response protein [Actinomycetota bacterium]|nr:Asp23/Gls24 family envelope stress response protein [Actinomycetota bacterium]